jgi:hypothetical protein
MARIDLGSGPAEVADETRGITVGSPSVTMSASVVSGWEMARAGEDAGGFAVSCRKVVTGSGSVVPVIAGIDTRDAGWNKRDSRAPRDGVGGVGSSARADGLAVDVEGPAARRA